MRLSDKGRHTHKQDGGGFPTCFDIVSLALRDVVSLVRVSARALPREAGRGYHGDR